MRFYATIGFFVSGYSRHCALMESFILILWKIFFISQFLSVHLGNCELQAKAGDVRLVNSRDGNSREGIVKVFLDDDWHWISPDGFDQPTATVLCRRAGFNGEAIPDKETYTSHTPPTKTLTCDGEEVTPLNCAIEDTEPEVGDDISSYVSGLDVWKNYTGAYVICNEFYSCGPIPIVISISVLVLALVILFAYLFHRYIHRRELAKMTESKPKDQNVAPMEFTALNLEAGPSNQKRPATEETSFMGEGKDTPTSSNPTYSSKVYVEPKGGNATYSRDMYEEPKGGSDLYEELKGDNAGGKEEDKCPDEAKGETADEDPDNPEIVYIEPCA